MWIAHEQHMPLWSEYPHLAPITGQTGYRTCLVPLKHPIKPCQVGSLNVHLVRSHHHKHLQEQLAPHFNSYLLQRSDGLRERTALRLFFRLQLEVYQVQVGHCQDIYARMLGCTLIEYGSKFDVKTATHTHLLHMYPQYTMHTHTQVYSTFWPGCPKRGGGGDSPFFPSSRGNIWCGHNWLSHSSYPTSFRKNNFTEVSQATSGIYED